MHPCREYWGQDVAYGSLVTGERARRGERAGALTEVWILDLRNAARAPRRTPTWPACCAASAAWTARNRCASPRRI